MSATAETTQSVDVTQTPVQVQAAPEPIYGRVGDGEYLTPFAVTIAYNPSSHMETAVAVLTKAAQLIPVGIDTDLGAIAGACKHPSPEVVLFGTKYTREQILSFFDRGFKFVHVFVDGKSDEVDGKSDKADNEAPNPYLEGESGHSFDQRVATFGLEDLHEHIGGISLVGRYIIDCIISAENPSYAAIDQKINPKMGAALLRGLKLCESFEATLAKIGRSHRGFDMIQDLIVRGETHAQIYQKIAEERLSKGVFLNLHTSRTDRRIDVFAVDTSIAGAEIMDIALVHKDLTTADVFAFYYLEPHVVAGDFTAFGWRITLITKGDLCAGDLFKELVPNLGKAQPAVSNVSKATMWLPAEQARAILRFH